MPQTDDQTPTSTPARGPSRVASMLALIVAGEAIFGLPFVVVRLFRPTLLDVFGITNLELGSAFSVYGVLAMIAYVPGGPLADRYSPRWLMALALIATALGGLVYMQIPSATTLTLLFGYWGVTTILLFWSPLIRATRNWGGDDAQGRAFGILDGGRGLFAAALGSVCVALFSAMLPEDAKTATLEQRGDALAMVIVCFTIGTIVAAVLVWFLIPDGERETKDAPAADRSQIWRNIGLVARNRAVWLQTLIVLTAYTGYKSLDDFSLYARDAFGFDDVAAAKVGTLALWVRPVAAIVAGVVGDRVGVARAVLVCFAITCVGNLVVAAGMLDPGMPWMLFTMVVTTSGMVFGLRGLYFALFRDAKVDPALTGTAAGMVSVLGYTPDVFVGPLNGYLTDAYPGATGHEYFFGSIAVFSALGLLSAIAFNRAAKA
ncbi:MAG: MFS transporter [Myxococcota bacterium]